MRHVTDKMLKRTIKKLQEKIYNMQANREIDWSKQSPSLEELQEQVIRLQTELDLREESDVRLTGDLRTDLINAGLITKDEKESI